MKQITATNQYQAQEDVVRRVFRQAAEKRRRTALRAARIAWMICCAWLVAELALWLWAH